VSISLEPLDIFYKEVKMCRTVLYFILLYITWIYYIHMARILLLTQAHNHVKTKHLLNCWIYQKLSIQVHNLKLLFLFYHNPDSCAQNASGSGQNREKSSISRFAMCQLTNLACTDLNRKRMIGKSQHLSSSLQENVMYQHFKLKLL